LEMQLEKEYARGNFNARFSIIILFSGKDSHESWAMTINKHVEKQIFRIRIKEGSFKGKYCEENPLHS
jgi:hypothetical protein